MGSKIIVCLRRQNVTAGVWRRNRLITLEHFEHSEIGHENFARWLGRFSGATCHLLIDSPDESLKLETLPHVLGIGRSAMVRRKLDQFQPSHVYKAALCMGRESEGRRDDRYLFTALTQEALLHPWLDIVERSAHPLSGIAQMPVACHRLARILSLSTENLLLITRHQHSLRQNHFVKGALSMSRTVNATSDAPHHLVGETEKALLYLLNAQTAGTSAPLQVVFAGVEEAGLADAFETTCQVIPSQILEKQLRLADDTFSQHPDLLFMAVIALHGCPGNLAQPSQMARSRSQQLRLGLNLAGAALLTSTAVAAGIHISTAIQLQQEAEDLSKLTRQLPPYASAKPHSQTPSGKQLYATVELASRIEHSYRTPLEFMQVLSAALDKLPEIQLDKLEWQLGEHATVLPVPNAPQFAVVEGKIHSRDATLLNTLVTHLKAHPSIATIENEQPDVAKPLHGNTQSPNTLTPQTFRLRIKFKEST
ncbi:uncharacterized protein NMK_1238 [Novimethylophilus kurashikiensis]|uniref:Uncharacterized protein n=2 Tax=Novimethylophilus kurashikiensis TaxID=1825523 RepID=A0A2R5F5Z2_9PROT|nr:uncharacterized protein NMK_1238 [Novimethylophilus kurashikiensis]